MATIKFIHAYLNIFKSEAGEIDFQFILWFASSHRCCRYRRQRIFLLFIRSSSLVVWPFHKRARAPSSALILVFIFSLTRDGRLLNIWRFFYLSIRHTCINLRIVFIIKSLRWLYGHTFAAMCGYIVNFMAKRALMVFFSQPLVTSTILCVISANRRDFVSLHTFSTPPHRPTHTHTYTPNEFLYARDLNELNRCRSAIRYASHIHRSHGSQFEITNLFLT